MLMDIRKPEGKTCMLCFIVISMVTIYIVDKIHWLSSQRMIGKMIKGIHMELPIDAKPVSFKRQIN
jgi:hypothetical protein